MNYSKWAFHFALAIFWRRAHICSTINLFLVCSCCCCWYGALRHPKRLNKLDLMRLIYYSGGNIVRWASSRMSDKDDFNNLLPKTFWSRQSRVKLRKFAVALEQLKWSYFKIVFLFFPYLIVILKWLLRNRKSVNNLLAK